MEQVVDAIEIRKIVEALLFASHEPLSLQKMRDCIAPYHPVTPTAIREALQAISDEYQHDHRPWMLEEVANGYLLRTRSLFAPYLEGLQRNSNDKLSRAATEVLAIIAYRQPITRSQLEALRGVDCSGVLQTLIDKELVATVGKADSPGKPSLFATTRQFLCYYGLKDIKQLPAPEELPEDEN